MSLTSVNDFRAMVAAIPKENLLNTWFFPVRMNAKEPDISKGNSFKANTAYRLSVYDAINRLKWGKNVGICAITNGIMFLDIDVSKGKILASKGFLDSLESTLVIKSRNGGRQYYYQNDGKYANQIVYEGKNPVGELRADWWYVVGAGSYVPSDENNNDGDGTYRIYSGDKVNSFSGIPGTTLKMRGNTEEVKQHNTKVMYDHEKIENRISNEDFAKMMENRIRIKR